MPNQLQHPEGEGCADQPVSLAEMWNDVAPVVDVSVELPGLYYVGDGDFVTMSEVSGLGGYGVRVPEGASISVYAGETKTRRSSVRWGAVFVHGRDSTWDPPEPIASIYFPEPADLGYDDPERMVGEDFNRAIAVHGLQLILTGQGGVESGQLRERIRARLNTKHTRLY